MQSVLFIRGVALGGQISIPKLKLVCTCQAGEADSKGCGSWDKWSLPAGEGSVHEVGRIMLDPD